MKNKFFRFIVLMLCLVLLLSGCGTSVTGVLNGPNPFGDPEKTKLLNELMQNTEPQYNTGWPENEFTAHIPCPDIGTVDHIYDYTPAGRFEIAVHEISRADSDAYIKALTENGWVIIASADEEYSAGTMLQKGEEEVYLNIATTDDAMGILITDESLATELDAEE